MRIALSAVALAVVTLGGCATTPPPVSVTRFSLAPDVARGSIAPALGAASTLEQQSYDEIVARELTRINFVAAGGGAARYLYSVEVTRDVRSGSPRRAPVTIGIGGGSGSYGGGVGLGASFGIGSKRADPSTITMMRVRLRDRATQQVVWEGRAEGASGDVQRIAAALFRDFPGPSGRTISVP